MSKKIAIIGTGLVGRSWAILYTRGGYDVTLYDVSMEILVTALPLIQAQLSSMESANLLHGKTASECFDRMTTSTDLKESLRGAELAHECVPEDKDLKRKVFESMDRVMEEHTILCSSTSCIMPSLFTEELNHRNNCIVGHPVNPPHYCPAVEVIPAPWTSAEVKARTVSIMEGIGMKPVVAKKECDGFILNRLQYAVLQEGWRLVKEGVCDAKDIDTVMTGGLGIRWSFIGPFETAHLNAPNGIRDYAERYSKGIVRVSNTFGSPEPFQGKTLSDMAEYLESEMPVANLNETRKWRDEILKQMAIFKQSMPAKP